MAAVQRPETEQDLARVVAQAAHGRTPLCIQGGGTRGRGGPPPGEVLSTSRLTGVELYEPGALTLVVRAGTALGEIEALLAGERQRLAFEPPDYRPLLGTEGEPTIGAVAAGNLSGPRRVQVGAARDFMLGVRFVDGTGAVVRNGGRVMKNVTGYDLVKLMAGSYGTLGVLTEIALKVLPAPEAAATLVLEGLGVAEAVEAMSAALCSPYEVSGAAHDPSRGTMLRIEGFEASVAYRAGRLRDLLSGYGDPRLERDPGTVAGMWRDVRDARALAPGGEDVWRISVRPSLAPEIARRLEGARLLLDWGGGLIWAGAVPGTDVRQSLQGLAGHATLVRGAADVRHRLGTFQPEPPAVAALSQGLRARFDPHGILNPGLLDATRGAA